MFALLFPGQGSQTDDDRAEVEALAPDLLEACIAAVGEDPFPRAAENTRFAQPAIFCTSLARLRRVDAPGDAAAFGGHSLGELTALTAAGALSLEDGLRLVVERGRLMGEATAGGMVVVRCDPDRAAELAADHGLVVANDNAPGQVVLSGAAELVDPTIAVAKARGLKARRLPVTGAFHSPLMAEAAEAFAATLAEVDFAAPAVPVYCCATAAPFTDPQRQLAEALTAPVRWREIALAMEAAGVERYGEVGPGTVLTGLVNQTLAAPQIFDPVGSDVLA
ncbi:MAG: acyltransferase domain-containing protein [Solirubrobacteraceae bacterium]